MDVSNKVFAEMNVATCFTLHEASEDDEKLDSCTGSMCEFGLLNDANSTHSKVCKSLLM